MHPTPVYSDWTWSANQGVIEIEPGQLVQMVNAGCSANAAGLVISWDLRHAPIKGVQALAQAMRREALHLGR
jgi:hypothetical protein